jgi:hypothetical protein
LPSAGHLATDPFLRKWKLNLEKSKIAGEQMKIADSGGSEHSCPPCCGFGDKAFHIYPFYPCGPGRKVFSPFSFSFHKQIPSSTVSAQGEAKCRLRDQLFVRQSVQQCRRAMT